MYVIQITFKVEDNSGKVTYYLQETHARDNCQGVVLTPKREHFTISCTYAGW